MTKNELIFKIKETTFLTEMAIKQTRSLNPPSVRLSYTLENLITLARDGINDDMSEALPSIKDGLEQMLSVIEHSHTLEDWIKGWDRFVYKGQRFFTFIDPGSSYLNTESIHSDLDKETLIKVIKHIYKTTGDHNHAIHYVAPLQRDLRDLCLSLDLDDEAYFKLLKEMADVTMECGDYYTNITIVLFELMRRRDILKAIGE